MKYPMKCNWIEYEKLDDSDNYLVTDYLMDEKFEIEECHIRFIEKLDGKTNPRHLLRHLSIAEYLDYMDALEELDLIRNSKNVACSFMFWIQTLVIIKDSRKFKKIATMLDISLLAAIIPAIILIVFSVKNINGDIFFLGEWQIYFGVVCGMIVGAILHELGHAMACIHYGGKVFEFGVMFQTMPAAYTLMTEEKIKGRVHKIHVILAGIEVNLILVALALWVCSCSYASKLGLFFFYFALVNIEMFVVNLLFIPGIDGMRALSFILGNDNLCDDAKYAIRNRSTKRRLKRGGMVGKVKLLTAYILEGTRIIYPLLVVLSIVALVDNYL